MPLVGRMTSATHTNTYHGRDALALLYARNIAVHAYPLEAYDPGAWDREDKGQVEGDDDDDALGDGDGDGDGAHARVSAVVGQAGMIARNDFIAIAKRKMKSK